jgi:hypothetical protein
MHFVIRRKTRKCCRKHSVLGMQLLRRGYIINARSAYSRAFARQRRCVPEALAEPPHPGQTRSDRDSKLIRFERRGKLLTDDLISAATSSLRKDDRIMHGSFRAIITRKRCVTCSLLQTEFLALSAAISPEHVSLQGGGGGGGCGECEWGFACGKTIRKHQMFDQKEYKAFAAMRMDTWYCSRKSWACVCLTVCVGGKGGGGRGGGGALCGR